MSNDYIDWNPDYWTEEEKKLIFNFWVERYSKYNTNMSISDNTSAGGYGFFDSERESIKYTTNLDISSPEHPVHNAYYKRRELLLNEQKISQLEDKIRLELILNAEFQSYKLWLNKNLFTIDIYDANYYIKQVKNKVAFLENLYKGSLAQLIEYDRKYKHPISNPDRDLLNNPITFCEYKSWLTRGTRTLLDNSDDAIIIKNNIKEEEEILYATINENSKQTYIPHFLYQIQEEREKIDFSKGIKRTKSGYIESINLNVTNESQLLLEKLSEAKDAINDIGQQEEKSEQLDTTNEKDSNKTEQDNKEKISNFFADIKETLKPKNSQININAYKDLFDTINANNDDGQEDDEGTDEDENIPHWMKVVKNNNQVFIKYKLFDRNKQLQKITSEWKSFEKRPENGDFWSITEKQIKEFKNNASNIWKNKKSISITPKISNLLKSSKEKFTNLKKKFFSYIDKEDREIKRKRMRIS